jgi:DNA invertase Pin-like site-specific DNA recombinase
VVVFRLDRLARDLVVQESLLAEIRRMGGQVFSTSQAEADLLVDDPGDPSRRMVRQILGAVAGYEKEMIRLRMRAGRARKKEQGGYATGSPPLGYKAVGRELVADDDEQKVLDRIRTLQSEGRSLREIGAALTGEGLQPKRGGTWQPGSLALIVRRLEATREREG